jgi:ribonuclease HII
VATARSPSVRIYRRASTRLEPLREQLARDGFRAVLPPDGIAEWECADARGIRIRAWQGVVMVEAPDDALADAFDRRHRQAFPSDRAIPDGGDPPEHVTLVAGSDESGKGERRLPLAVAAVAIPLDAEAEVLARGVRDSKLCTASEVAELARWIVHHFDHAVRQLDAVARADALHEAGGNETRLLAELHAGCLRELHASAPFALARVDRFAPGRPVAALFREVIVDECIRGERHIACAAASILARAAVHGTCHAVPGTARHVPRTEASLREHLE